MTTDREIDNLLNELLEADKNNNTSGNFNNSTYNNCTFNFNSSCDDGVSPLYAGDGESVCATCDYLYNETICATCEYNPLLSENNNEIKINFAEDFKWALIPFKLILAPFKLILNANRQVKSLPYNKEIEEEMEIIDVELVEETNKMSDDEIKHQIALYKSASINREEDEVNEYTKLFRLERGIA